MSGSLVALQYSTASIADVGPRFRPRFRGIRRWWTKKKQLGVLKITEKRLPTKIPRYTATPINSRNGSFQNSGKWDKTSFNVTGEKKNSSWASRYFKYSFWRGCLEILPLSQKTNAWAWNQWKSAKTRQNLCKTMEETICQMTFPIYLPICVYLIESNPI